MPTPTRKKMPANAKVDDILRTLRLRRQALGGFLASLALIVAAFTLWSCQTGGTPRASDRAALGFAEEPDIRVRLKKGAETASVTGPKRVVVRALGVSRFESLDTPVTVKIGASGFEISDAQGKPRLFGNNIDVEILPREPRAGATTSNAFSASDSFALDSVAHVGFLTLRGRWSEPGNKFDVVNTIPIETYLPGVLAKELLAGWPLQSYQAQAVAARSYALHERGRSRRDGRTSDVEATDADQVYGGQTLMLTPLEAVKSTRGQVLTSDGQLLRAYYSAACGGRSASAAEIWPTSRGFEFNLATALQGQRRQWYCQSSARYVWNVQRSVDDTSKRIKAWGRDAGHKVLGISRLRLCEVKDRNDAARPNRYRLTDDRGRTYDLSAEDLRNALNYSSPELPPLPREVRAFSGDLTMQFFGDQLTLSGRGFGHGVGLCQWCAKGMADRAMDYPTMLREFYPGSLVQRAY
jgi:stage II sporulation protein D